MPYIDNAAREKLKGHVEDFPSLVGDGGIGNLSEVICFIGGQAVISGSTTYSDPDYSQLPWCPSEPELWGALSRGEYNFLITMACHIYALSRCEKCEVYPKYETFNDLIGAIEFCIGSLQTAAEALNGDDVMRALGVLRCSQLELYRVCVGRYEDHKIKANGSISNLDLPWVEDMWEAEPGYPDG